MKQITKSYPLWEVNAQISLFEAIDGISEYHVLISPEPGKGDFTTQLHHLRKAAEHLVATEWGNQAKIVFKRYFVSDAGNQTQILRNSEPANMQGATSVIGQSPLDGCKVALWMWLQSDVQIAKEPLRTVIHNGYRHIYTACIPHPEGDSEQQTHDLLTGYGKILEQCQCTLADHCIRTWFFVRDVDVNYAGVVKARREDFIKTGLTEQTHYIASTGIAGYDATPEVSVLLDSYAVKGLDDGQIQYLYALDYLNPTYEYGVTFERGTAVEYGDRKHVFISGTASIDHRGEIVHPGDIVRQTQRMWKNVEALLIEAGSGFGDLAQMIVYLRDTADYLIVKSMFDQEFPHTPKILVLAPVCRPGWLIEMECIAIKAGENPKYRRL